MSNWIQTKAVMEKAYLKELTGTESLVFIPFTFYLPHVSFFRPTLDQQGEMEPYTNVYFKNGHSECIDMRWDDLQKLVKNEQPQ